MSIIRTFIATALLVAATHAMTVIAAEGMMVIGSPHDAGETMDRLERIVEERGLNVFARIDHAAGARRADLSLRPTELLIFGNPRGGTPFMQCAQSVGIDLPLKALVWEDEASDVWVGYNDPAFLAQRHEVPDCPVVSNLRDALRGMVEEAVER